MSKFNGKWRQLTRFSGEYCMTRSVVNIVDVPVDFDDKLPDIYLVLLNVRSLHCVQIVQTVHCSTYKMYKLLHVSQSGR
jgi:hypothetical protein